MAENEKKYPPKSLMFRFLISLAFLAIYIFLCPYLYVISISIKYMDDLNSDCAIAFFALTFIPFFICAEIQTVSFVVAISIPAIFIPPYYRFLRFVFFTRIFGPAISV